MFSTRSIPKQKSGTDQTYVLKNDNVEMVIDHPLSNYASSRFDWTGKISSVKLKGVEISTLENLKAIDEKSFGKGFYNEFGIEKAVGFDEIKEGDWFPKIGIGLLKKVGEKYDFAETYEIKPASFKITQEGHQITIACEQSEYNDYAYELTKNIQLAENVFNIKYNLQNTGSKNILTNEYNHNFLSFGKEQKGCNFLLNFAFNINPKRFDKTVNHDDLVVIGEDNFSCIGNPKEQFFFGNISGNKPVNATWELISRHAGFGIRETGNFKTKFINIWGWKHVVSPELFYEISLKPGEETSWTRSYEIFELNH